MSLIPVVLCGGAGSRLWPISRETHPKPFIRLPDGESLLQKAVQRGAALAGVREIMAITNREFFFRTQEDIAESSIASLPVRLVLEPARRNTAAAVAVAALDAVSRDAEAIVLVLAADHLIADGEAFQAAVIQAKALAKEGKIVTFGIAPDAPETGYGYIEADGTQVRRFVEKPDITTAQSYLESGQFLWNSGMFCFRATKILEEMALHCPDILEASRAALGGAFRETGALGEIVRLPEDLFAKVPSNSIDEAVMEHTHSAAVVACDIGWSDVGSWDVLGDMIPQDALGNRIQGEVLLHHVSDCHIQAAGRVVGAVGICNLSIIDTPDALLVASNDSLQDVKHIYTQLKKAGHDAHKLHRTVYRPWGSYTVLEEGLGFKIKRIEVKPGGSLSLQMHHHRSEHWVVVSGEATITIDGVGSVVKANESVYINATQRHRLENTTPHPLQLIEVQTGAYLGEDDIVVIPL